MYKRQVVALDVKNGDVLAMASYPDFDPNLFANGISTADWKSLQSKNPRDPLAPAPLYNVAAKSAVQPGSTFKMVTATAALQCGLNPQQRLYDNGYVQPVSYTHLPTPSIMHYRFITTQTTPSYRKAGSQV